MRDESVYFDGGMFRNVVRLSIPVHPVVYVTPGVEEVHALREANDPRNFSDPAAVQAGRVQSRSIGAGLGFDPALFVQQAVRASQARGEWLSDIVEGRLTRLSLGSDGRIPTPEWFEPSEAQIVPQMPGQEAPRSDADKPAAEPSRTTAGAGTARDGAVAAPATAGAKVSSAVAAAPSFSQQLRSAGTRPMADATRPGAATLPVAAPARPASFVS